MLGRHGSENKMLLLQEKTFEEERHLEIRIKVKKHMDIIKQFYHWEVINIGQGRPRDRKKDSRKVIDYIT